MRLLPDDLADVDTGEGTERVSVALVSAESATRSWCTPARRSPSWGGDPVTDDRGTAAMESLYPFLYAETSDLAAVLEEVRASTVAKTTEIPSCAG